LEIYLFQCQKVKVTGHKNIVCGDLCTLVKSSGVCVVSESVPWMTSSIIIIT